MDYLKIFAPATVANVSCGFDSLGFAVVPSNLVKLTSNHKVAQSISADVTADAAAGDIEEVDIVTDKVLLTSKQKVAQGISADLGADVAAGEIEEAETFVGLGCRRRYNEDILFSGQGDLRLLGLRPD